MEKEGGVFKDKKSLINYSLKIINNKYWKQLKDETAKEKNEIKKNEIINSYIVTSLPTSYNDVDITKLAETYPKYFIYLETKSRYMYIPPSGNPEDFYLDEIYLFSNFLNDGNKGYFIDDKPKKLKLYYAFAVYLWSNLPMEYNHPIKAMRRAKIFIKEFEKYIHYEIYSSDYYNDGNILRLDFGKPGQILIQTSKQKITVSEIPHFLVGKKMNQMENNKMKEYFIKHNNLTEVLDAIQEEYPLGRRKCLSCSKETTFYSLLLKDFVCNDSKCFSS